MIIMAKRLFSIVWRRLYLHLLLTLQLFGSNKQHQFGVKIVIVWIPGKQEAQDEYGWLRC